MIYTAVGFAVGGFIGGIADLIKDLASFIAEKLGFEGMSEFLDSFSIREMIESGFGDMVEFFDALFTETIPAIIAGAKAAINPFDGKSFGEAYQERLAYGPEGKPPATPRPDDDFTKDDVTQEEIDRYAKEIEGMNPDEIMAFMKVQRKIDFDANQKQMLAEQAAELERRKNFPLMTFAGPYSNMMMIPVSTGAQMEATQTETLNEQEAKVNIAPVITTTNTSATTSNTAITSTNQNAHIDRTLVLGSGQLQGQ